MRSASGTPHPALYEVSKGFWPLRPPNQRSRSCPHPTHTLTLALELADDGVQVSVLGRDVAPADRHLSAAASAWRHQRPGSLRLRLSSGSAASGSGRAPPPGRAAGLRAPPARLRLPSTALPGRPLAAPPPLRCRPGAVRAAVLKGAARRQLGGGNFSGTQRGRGGALTPRGRSWAGVPLQDFLEELLLCPNGLWPRPLSDPFPVPEGSPDVTRRSLSGHGGSGGGGAEGVVRGLRWFSAEGLFPDLTVGLDSGNGTVRPLAHPYQVPSS